MHTTFSWQTDDLTLTGISPCATVSIVSRFVPLPEIVQFMSNGWIDTGARIVGVGGALLARMTKTTTSYSNVTSADSAGVR